MLDPDDDQDHGPPLRERGADGKEIKVSGQEYQAERQKKKPRKNATSVLFVPTISHEQILQAQITDC
jgi:hypothetical protein